LFVHTRAHPGCGVRLDAAPAAHDAARSCGPCPRSGERARARPAATRSPLRSRRAPARGERALRARGDQGELELGVRGSDVELEASAHALVANAGIGGPRPGGAAPAADLGATDAGSLRLYVADAAGSVRSDAAADRPFGAGAA